MTLELAKGDTTHTSLVKDYKKVLEFRHGGQETLHHFAHCRFSTLNLPLFYFAEPYAVLLRYPVC